MRSVITLKWLPCFGRPHRRYQTAVQARFYAVELVHLLIRSAIFWDITQRRVIILYRRFGTTYRSHLQGSRSPRFLRFLDPWRFQRLAAPKRRTFLDLPLPVYAGNVPEESRCHLHRGGSLKSHTPVQASFILKLTMTDMHHMQFIWQLYVQDANRTHLNPIRRKKKRRRHGLLTRFFSYTQCITIRQRGLGKQAGVLPAGG
jgi:hypothetical protein